MQSKRENTDEYQILLTNLERLRVFVKLDMQEIDEYANLGKGTYSRIIGGKQQPRFIELATIGKSIYEISVIDLLKPNLKLPTLKNLPEAIVAIAKSRTGKTPRAQKKRDLIHYCIHTLAKEFSVGDEFTNADIIRVLETKFKDIPANKSIEWQKSILSSFIVDTGKTRPGRTRPHKIYRLTKKIPHELVQKSLESLTDSEE